MSNQRSGSVLFLLDRTLRQMRHSLQVHLNEKNVKLTVDQWILLNEASSAGVISHNELSKRVSKDPASVTRIVSSLEELKLITRIPSRKDQRVLLLKVTAAGRKELQQAAVAIQNYRKSVLKGIEKEELLHVKMLLDKMFENTGGKLI
ncbi:MAG: MarR family transcriptional regulator [Bacteroidia bacterium]|nr:MarR family transcriptional regulator [Bacteroidia bacterium]